MSFTQILRFFAACRDDGWEEVASQWLITALVIAILCAALMLVTKWILKKQAGPIHAWSGVKTVLFNLIGLLPILLILVVIFAASEVTLQVCLGLPSLFVGTFFSWVVYLLSVFLVHLVLWPRDIF